MTTETFFANFGHLADALNGVQKLRELILQLAVQGKLVPQDPNDEAASVLLERNQAEKSRLAKEKKIRATKENLKPSVDALDQPVPLNWDFEYLGNIAHVITKGATPTTYGYQFQSEGISFVKVENVKGGHIVKNNISTFICHEAHESQARSQLEAGDILFSIAGTIGETCVVKESDLPANTNQALAIIRGTKGVFNAAYLKMQLDTFVANAVKAKARGGAMNNVSLGDLRDLLVFVPSLAEQKRIVAKVDQLMALCDELETKLNQAQQHSEKLMEATVQQLLVE